MADYAFRLRSTSYGGQAGSIRPTSYELCKALESTQMPEKEISREEFLFMCLEYAGPNTLAYWKDFLVTNNRNWKFVVSGVDKPVPPKILLDAATRMDSNTIALFFASEEDVRSRYGYPEEP